MYLAIGGTLSGIVIVAVVVYLLFFHDAWESDNLRRLLNLNNEADALVQANEYEKARAKYDELFDVLGDRAVEGEYLRGEIERARIASAENNKKVEPILAARAEVPTTVATIADAEAQVLRRRASQDEHRTAFINGLRLYSQRDTRNRDPNAWREVETERLLGTLREQLATPFRFENWLFIAQTLQPLDSLGPQMAGQSGSWIGAWIVLDPNFVHQIVLIDRSGVAIKALRDVALPRFIHVSGSYLGQIDEPPVQMLTIYFQVDAITVDQLDLFHPAK